MTDRSYNVHSVSWSDAWWQITRKDVAVSRYLANVQRVRRGSYRITLNRRTLDASQKDGLSVNYPINVTTKDEFKGNKAEAIAEAKWLMELWDTEA